MPFTELAASPLLQGGNPDGIAFDSTGNYLAVGEGTGGVVVWNRADWTTAQTLLTVSGARNCAFSPDGSLFSAVAADTETLRTFETTGWTEYTNASIPTLYDYTEFGYSADGQYVAVINPTNQAEVYTVGGDVAWTLSKTFTEPGSTSRTLCWHPDGYLLLTDRTGNLWLIDQATLTVVDSIAAANSPLSDAYRSDASPTGPWIAVAGGGDVIVLNISGGTLTIEKSWTSTLTATNSVALTDDWLYISNDIDAPDDIHETGTWAHKESLNHQVQVWQADFSPDRKLFAFGDRTNDHVRVYNAPLLRSLSMHASATSSGSATATRTRALNPVPTGSGELDIDAEGPITGWHLLDNFSEIGALDPYTGQKTAFSLDTTNPVHGTHVLRSGGDDVGITHTEWTLRYGSRYRFWMDPSGNFSGLYIGSTQGGLSTGAMEGVGVGSDPTFGSLDIVNISAGLWDYDKFVRAPISSGSWHQFEVIVEDPSVTGSQIILRLLDDKGQTVAAEVTRSTAGFAGVAEPVIGVAADTTGARYDKLETDDLTTFPGHWIQIHGSASGSLSASTTKDRDVTYSPTATGTAGASVTKDRPFALAGTGSGAGTIRLQRASDRALIFGASAAGAASASVTKTTRKTFSGTGAATAAVPLDKERATTFTGSGSATGTLATARERISRLSLAAGSSLTGFLDRSVIFSLAGTGTGIAHGRLLRGESANIISTRTLIGRTVESTPTQVGEFTRATPRLSGTAVESAPQLKGRVVEKTPELSGRFVREHPPITGTLIRD